MKMLMNTSMNQTHMHIHISKHTQSFGAFQEYGDFRTPRPFTSVRSHGALSLDFFLWSYIVLIAAAQQPAPT